MPFSPELCPACLQALPPDFINRPAPESCPSCQRRVQLLVFPALFRKKKPAIPAVKKEGEAGCFYYPDKPAVAVCDFCGVFLSDLCDLQINGKHICPSCYAKPANKAGLLPSDRTRTLFDGIAIGLAVVPFFAFGLLSLLTAFILGFLSIFTIFTSLAAIFVAIRYWKTPGSVIPRSRVRYILAIVFASLQLLGWVILIGLVAYYLKNST